MDKQKVYISFKALKNVKVESGIYKTFNVLKEGHKARRGKLNISLQVFLSAGDWQDFFCYP